MVYKHYKYKCECGEQFERAFWDDAIEESCECKCGKIAAREEMFRARPVKFQRHEMVFDKPNPAKDIPETLRRMEASGGLRTPDSIAAAKIKLAAVKGKDYGNMDYQHRGHPLGDD